MTNERYDDEVLSAIIDDEAEASIVAAVQADPQASARLADMRAAVEIVGESTSEATSERRASSIAAALAAATPAPEVTSLAAARHERAEAKKSRLSNGWIAAVAAAVAFIIAVPIAIGLGGSDSFDTATEATQDSFDTAANSATDAAGDAAEDVAASADSFAAETEAVDDAMEEEPAGAMEDSATEDEAMEDAGADTLSEDGASDGEAEDAGDAVADAAQVPTTTAADLTRRMSVNNIDTLDGQINTGIVPRFTADEVIAEGVPAACVEPSPTVTQERPYDLVNLTPFGGADRLVVVEFADDGTTRVLDAEDCALLR